MGAVQMGRTAAPAWLRIVTNIERDDNGCWIWQRSTNGKYGKLSVGRTLTYAHRAAYEAFVGPIPEGLTIDHLCRVQTCCNPEHLEPVEGDENIRRHFRLQTHCRQGHEFTEANTYRHEGRRRCLTCRRLRSRVSVAA